MENGRIPTPLAISASIRLDRIETAGAPAYRGAGDFVPVSLHSITGKGDTQ